MPREWLDAYPPATARSDEMLEAPLTPRAVPGRREAAAVCRRSGVLRRGPLVGGERPHPDARRRRLCAREPPGDLAAIRGFVPGPQSKEGRRLLRHAARQPGALGAEG